MSKKTMTPLFILILVCFTWLVLAPVANAPPPKKSRKTEKVEKRKPIPRKETAKRTPTVGKKKQAAESPKRVPDSKKDKARDYQKKIPSKEKVKSYQKEKEVKTKEAYDYFRDKNGDGIDDRLKEKKTSKKGGRPRR